MTRLPATRTARSINNAVPVKGISSKTPVKSAAELAADQQAAALAADGTVRCVCGWTFVGPIGLGMDAAREHRRKVHPEVRARRRRGRGSYRLPVGGRDAA